MALSQEGRLLNFTTSSFSNEEVVILRLRATEGMSQLYTFELDLIHDEEEVGVEPFNITPDQVLNKPMSVAVNQRDGANRFFSGICSRFSQGSRDERFSKYRAIVRPQVWLLTQSSHNRIFQNLSIPDVLAKVLDGFNPSLRLQGHYEPRNYCVQYRETDWDFASRLMEEEGIFYFFEHTSSGHTLVIADADPAIASCPSKAEIPYITDISVNPDEWEGAINSFQVSNQIRTGKYRVRDHQFQLPTNSLEAEQMSRFDVNGNRDNEIYGYPGEFAKLFDGINSSGGEQPSELSKVFAARQHTIDVRQQEIDVAYKSAIGSADSCALIPGFRFKLTTHPTAENNRNHTIVSTKTEALQDPGYVSDEARVRAYIVNFTSIPQGEGQAQYRPPRMTERPIMHGCQTAVVVGPAGEEIFVDKFGRVKVQFHWDRDGQNNAASSCWLRVGTSIAGNKWGTMFIPRIGQEVLVDFLQGDPDQPIITGSVYNPETMPHYDLPKFKTLTYIKTRTSPDDGKGFNEIRFEDKQGKEQVFIHSQKRYDLRAKGSMYETCGGNRQEVIGVRSDNKPGGNLAITVGGSYDLHVKADNFIGIDGKLNEGVKGDVVEGYDSSQQTVVKSKVEVNAQKITLEGSQSVTLKVGSSCVIVDMMGITIQGPMVKINSGGSAPPTGPATLDAPLDAEAADTGEPGYLDRPRSGGGGGGRRRRTLNGQHAPSVTRNDDGTYSVGGDRLRVRGDDAYVGAVMNDLSTMYNTPSGRATMDRINAGTGTSTIHAYTPAPGAGDNAFAAPGAGPSTTQDFVNATPAGQPVYYGDGSPALDANGNQLTGTGTGGDSNISYNPGDWPSPIAASGAPGDVILFHEMQHADNQMNGTYDGTPRTDGFDTNEEFNAIGPENQYRDERDVPRRTNHHDL
ncbi:MAG TPA: type VI secretion system tip protein TssI/VgrG [Pyrinomonadaceae bacterium]|nr:type VI secretion system tip protein TssI/VgrG [Pyrinomonadaceae bacterium]